MKFLGQGFQTTEAKQDRQTDAAERITTPQSRVLIIWLLVCVTKACDIFGEFDEMQHVNQYHD